VYRWAVPAGILRAGLNRVRVSSSALVKPSEVLGTADDRLLGVGVSRVRLIHAASLAEVEADVPGPM
jgi:hypothetical protein